MMKYYAADIEKICGVKRPRLQTWMERGWITPGMQRAGGHGVKNIFSRNDLYMIAFFRKAVESGLPRKTVAKFIRELQHEFSGGLEVPMERHLASTADPIYLVIFRKGGKVVDVFFKTFSELKPKSRILKDADDFIGINFGKVMDEVNSKISEIKG
jgi:DNA-binding transcriptional MerR regulator